MDAVIKSLLVKDAMLHETNDDCNYKGNVTELWWRSSRGGSALRRIIGDKEIVEMAPKLRKCNIVHIYDLSCHWLPITLSMNEVINQNNSLFEPSPTTNLERAGKTNITYASQTPIESLFTSRWNGEVSTPTNGRDGSMTLTRKDSAKTRFLAPSFLCRRCLSGLQMPTYPKSLVGQNPSEQHLINALECGSQDEANAAKKNVENDAANAQKDNDTANSQKDNDMTNAQKENVRE
ncbi:hypothetical protein Cgig2_011799 [Carnegiea gigantea]|uniref:Uncharacterized protein n=1 Tax=Carnegiea gigantea TaxID=171969 RepID=A0A9Q1JMX5_9CARY|nr:hypothetical protein Cgig2_011799 [Carnegiea gigantea]